MHEAALRKGGGFISGVPGARRRYEPVAGAPDLAAPKRSHTQ